MLFRSSFSVGDALEPRIIDRILDIPGFSRAFRDREGDATRVVERLNGVIASRGDEGIDRIDMINAGFYRNRGAYVVGRAVTAGERCFPFILALLNDDDGIYVDAVLSSEADAHNIFSSTLANFHVTSDHYHELSEFLHSIMPQRPLGLHYSTDRKSTRLNSSHSQQSRMPSSA